jgi:hypothetical protein
MELTTQLKPDFAAIPAERLTDFLNMSEAFVQDDHKLKQQRLMQVFEQVYWAGRLDGQENKK